MWFILIAVIDLAIVNKHQDSHNWVMRECNESYGTVLKISENDIYLPNHDYF